MVYLDEIVSYLEMLYEKLNEKHNPKGECEDGYWKNFLIQENRIKKEHVNSADHIFLMHMCFRRWRTKRQFEEWLKVYENFETLFNGDLTNIKSLKDAKRLGFSRGNTDPTKWIYNLSTYLNKENTTFQRFLGDLRDEEGLKVRNRIAEVIGAKSKPKRVSTFIRDFMEKDVFPIDSNVQKMLSNFGLPADEEVLVKLCRTAKINPRVFERLLYSNGKNICGNGLRSECPVKNACLAWIFKLGRCRYSLF